MIKLGTNDIGSLYFGSNPIGKAYLGSNLVFQRGSGPGPTPTNYIPYIRGGGDGSYIDTGITSSNTVRVIIWARNFNPRSGFLCGARGTTSSYQFILGSVGEGYVGLFRLGLGSNQYYSSDYQYHNMSHYHKYEFTGQATLLVDDEPVIEHSMGTFSWSETIYLYGANSGGTLAGMDFPVDICACKIYKDNVLVRDYTPVNTPNVGLYDSVSQTLFTNQGSGSFTYGTFNSDAYVPLDYISCANNQWFDTGVYGTKDLYVNMRIMPTNTVARYTGIFGEFSSTYTSVCAISSGNGSSANINVSYRLGTDLNTNTFYSGSSVTNVPLAIVKEGARAYMVKQDTVSSSEYPSAEGTRTAADDFTTHGTLTMCGTRDTENTFRDALFEGRIYYLGIGGVKNYVPAKVNGRAGMYDTYNDVFVRSASGTDFVAGNEL